MEFNIPSILITLIPFLLFLYMFLKSLTIFKSSSKYSHIPGPKPLPLIGNIHLMLGGAAPHRLFRDLAAKYGPLMHLQLGEIDFLIVSSDDVAKQVLKTHDLNFANRPPGLVAGALTRNYADLIFAPYGDHWRQMRRICTLELLSARRVQSFLPIRAEENMNMAKWIASRHGSPADLSEKLHLSSYDVITRVTVGAKTGDREAVISVIGEAIKLSSGFLLADLYPSIKVLPLITGLRFKIRHMLRKLDGVLDSILEQHRAGGDGGGIEDLVDLLLKIQKDGTELPLTTPTIKALMLDMFAGGTETSPTVVEWAMSEMMTNPNTLKKAQDEVRKVFDDKGFVDEEKLNDLKYLKLVVKETLRLHPPAPFLLPRISTERCEINGYEIPAKTRVIVNAWALGRDPKLWNEAEEFIPERFEENSFDFKGTNLEYIPFGAGRRICAGISFGMASVETVLATLLYHFDWKLPSDQPLDMSETFGASVRRKHHLRLIPFVKRPLTT